ncbi:MAG TPA: LON peptidase substrate-binding domain-containing protein, partial [Polyangiaceae bacterium]
MAPDPTGKVLDVTILPLRDIVVFPSSVRPLTIWRGGPREVPALRPGERIAVFTQRDPTLEHPTLADLYPVGVLVEVVQTADLPDAPHKLVVAHGLERVRATAELEREPVLRARIEVLEEEGPRPDDADLVPTVESVRELAAQIIAASPFLSNELIEPLGRLDKPGPLSDFVAAILPSLKTPARQELLETLDQAKRLRRVHEELVREMESIRARMRIQETVERKVGKAQHDF